MEGGACKSVDVRHLLGRGAAIDIGSYRVVIGGGSAARAAIVRVNSVDDNGPAGWKGVVVYREVIGLEEEAGEHRCNSIALPVGQVDDL